MKTQKNEQVEYLRVFTVLSCPVSFEALARGTPLGYRVYQSWSGKKLEPLATRW